MARTSFATRAEGVRTLASTMRQTGIKAVYWKLRLCERGRAPCRTRTCDLLVRSLMQVVYPVGSSMVYLTPRTRCSPEFGSKLFTDCSLGAQNCRRASAIIFKFWRLANASYCSSIKTHTCGTAFAASICRAIVGTQRPHHAPESNRLDGRQTSSARRRRCHASGAVQAQKKSLDDVLCTRDAAQTPIGNQRISWTAAA